MVSEPELANIVREFVRLMDIQEESDSGRMFRPNRISSCRAMDALQLNELILKMKELTKDVL